MDETRINYKKDVIVNTIAQIFYLFVLWLMTMLTPRLSNSANQGIFTLALSVSNICTAIATYSISSYVATDLKHKYNDQHYLYFGLTSTFISLVVSIIISLAFGYQHDSPLFWAVILYYLYKCSENITITIQASMQRAGKLHISGYALIIKALISLIIFTVSLLISKNLVISFGALAAFGFLYLFFVDYRLLRKYTNQSYKLTKDIYKIALSLFIVALPLFIYGEAFASIASFPRMVLGNVVSKEVVGYFGTMAAISSLIQSAITAILTPFLPKISKHYFDNNRKDLLKLLGALLGFIIVLTGIAFLCGCFLDKWVMGILYPKDPASIDYAHFFKWIILATGVQAIVVVTSLSLVAIRNILAVGISSVIGLISMFIFSYVLIPNKTISGVIYVFFIAYGLMAVISIAYMAIKIYKLKVKDSN